MMRSLQIFFACFVLSGLSGCAGMVREKIPPVTTQQIIQFSKAGEPPANIIARIQHARTVYDLTASQYAQLSKEGVADTVLDYMQQTHIKEITYIAQRNAYYNSMWYGGYGGGYYGGFGYGPWGYPGGWGMYPRGFRY